MLSAGFFLSFFLSCGRSFSFLARFSEMQPSVRNVWIRPLCRIGSGSGSGEPSDEAVRAREIGGLPRIGETLLQEWKVEGDQTSISQ
jgi:hypothetical protein